MRGCAINLDIVQRPHNNILLKSFQEVSAYFRKVSVYFREASAYFREVRAYFQETSFQNFETNFENFVALWQPGVYNDIKFN